MVSDGKGVPALVDACSGEESFVCLDWHIEVNKPVISLLRIVPRSAMKYLVYIDTDKVLSRSVPKKDPHEIPRPRLGKRSDADDE